MNDTHCSLCSSSDIGLFYKNKNNQRTYWRCGNCELIFLDSFFFLKDTQEKQEYDNHNNSPHDDGYVNFLSQVLSPIQNRLSRGEFKNALDFGSGPGPTLNLLLQEYIPKVDIYDPFYRPNSDILKNKYELVTCTEVIEHFYKPFESFKLLFSLVDKKGTLATMTHFYDESKDFASWYYVSHLTHVCFYTVNTMKWIADSFNYKVDTFGERVAIFTS